MGGASSLLIAALRQAHDCTSKGKNGRYRAKDVILKPLSPRIHPICRRSFRIPANNDLVQRNLFRTGQQVRGDGQQRPDPKPSTGTTLRQSGCPNKTYCRRDGNRGHRGSIHLIFGLLLKDPSFFGEVFIGVGCKAYTEHKTCNRTRCDNRDNSCGRTQGLRPLHAPSNFRVASLKLAFQVGWRLCTYPYRKRDHLSANQVCR